MLARCPVTKLSAWGWVADQWALSCPQMQSCYMIQVTVAKNWKRGREMWCVCVGAPVLLDWVIAKGPTSKWALSPRSVRETLEDSGEMGGETGSQVSLTFLRRLWGEWQAGRKVRLLGGRSRADACSAYAGSQLLLWEKLRYVWAGRVWVQLRKLNRRVLRAGFRCPCVFELVDSGKKKNRRSRSIVGLHLRERERFLRIRCRCRALQEEVRVTVGLSTC